ncbi:MAG: hypothetical protein QOH61_1826 [Chloroflexota bacterium]|nr:hypothetical protein [Chloroflexota bacterium]
MGVSLAKGLLHVLWYAAVVIAIFAVLAVGAVVIGYVMHPYPIMAP